MGFRGLFGFLFVATIFDCAAPIPGMQELQAMTHMCCLLESDLKLGTFSVTITFSFSSSTITTGLVFVINIICSLAILSASIMIHHMAVIMAITTITIVSTIMSTSIMILTFSYNHHLQHQHPYPLPLRLASRCKHQQPYRHHDGSSTSIFKPWSTGTQDRTSATQHSLKPALNVAAAKASGLSFK